MLSRLLFVFAVVFSCAFGKPNIIFIMADDLGYGDLGCYGQKTIQTPRLDQMAAEGLRFTQCYAGSPVCAPSRSVLMTGQHTGHTTVRGNMAKVGGVKGLGGAKGRLPLMAEDVTVAEVLKRVGYVTGMTGKWGLGEPGTTGEPNAQGFDEWFGFLNQRRAHNHYPEYLWRNGEKVVYEANKGKAEKVYSHDRFTDFAKDFIRRNAAKDFFLYLPYCVPHDDYQMPKGHKPDPKRVSWSKQERSHAAMVERLDRDVGAILDLLVELKIDEETIVFFCSDNGAAKRWDGRFDSSGALKGRKRDLTEGGIRTPMIVRWPAKVPAGKVSDTVWYFADVLPTLADLGDAAIPKNVDGLSLLPTLRGRVQQIDDRLLYWEFYEGGFKQAARYGDWKLIRESSGSASQLFKISEDPSEAKNLAKAHPKVVDRIEKLMAKARTNSKEWPSPVDR
ncbi:MAG: arylsulfatase [Akkermansiaceae bacterium]